MRYSDSDINGHVNNTRYADFACDAIDMEQLEQKRFLSELQIGYLAECRPGELLVLESGQQGENLYIRGVDEEGKARFESELQFGQVIP